MNWDDLKDKLNKRPPDEIFVVEDGIKWLPVDYVLDKLNEIFGFENWRICDIKMEEVKRNDEEFLGRSCTLQFEFKHPDTGQWVKRSGVSSQYSPTHQKLIDRAFLNAVMSLGDTFGRHLSNQFE